MLSPGMHLEEMEHLAAEELKTLCFPPCPLFELYWLCCVFTNYGTPEGGLHFDRIVVPDWFPLPFGLRCEKDTSLRGMRIYPPQVWGLADVKYWGVKVGPLFPDPETCVVLSQDHPIRAFVRGRPSKKGPDGGFWYDYNARMQTELCGGRGDRPRKEVRNA
jgi:hypothetical protein